MSAVPSSRLQIDGLIVTPDTPVLQRRPLLPGADVAGLPRFADERWTVRAAHTDRHSPSQAIIWREFAAEFVPDTKLYLFALLNVLDDAPRLPNANSDFPGLKTIQGDMPYLRYFLRWLLSRGRESYAQITEADLLDYLLHIQDLEDKSTDWRRRALVTVQRLHAYRSVLPEAQQLAGRTIWGGITAADLVNAPAVAYRENRTNRIRAEVMEVLLSAALLTVETIATDLLPFARRLLAMRTIAHHAMPPDLLAGVTTYNHSGHLAHLLPALIAADHPVPAIADANGDLVLDQAGMAVGGWLVRSLLRGKDTLEAVQRTGLPFRRDYLQCRTFSEVNGHRWRTHPVDACELRRILSRIVAACFIVITYLSGVRTGETLNLRCGCISRDERLGLIFMSGEQEKARDHRKERSPQTIPWVVIEPVAQAVAVLEALSPGDLLFPSGQFCGPDYFTEYGQSRNPGCINNDLRKFIAWFNTCIAPTIEHPVIPSDAHGPIQAPRFRRTLAWHIARRPGGTAAGAIQYGHVETQMFQGYAGLADSGFPDEVAFERLLVRAEALHDDAQHLAAGEHVSGPSADEYRDRVGPDTFAGITITTKAQARALESNPALAVHHGDLLTCVYRHETAKCREGEEENSGPNWGRCQLTCRNIARTDRDIDALRCKIAALEADLAGPQPPAPLRQRIEARVQHFRDVLSAHERSRLPHPSEAPQ